MLALAAGHLALGGSNVGTALQKLRRQTGRNHWRSGVQRGHGQGEAGRGLSDQHRDGVLKLRALGFYVDGLGAGVFEQSLGLGNIHLRDYAAVVAVFGEFQRFS